MASLGARIPDIAQTTSYLDAFSISSRPMQVDSVQAVLITSDSTQPHLCLHVPSHSVLSTQAIVLNPPGLQLFWSTHIQIPLLVLRMHALSRI